jgi:glycerate 2-kinase
MPLRLLIVPDKFKGTLTAEAAARAMSNGWRASRPADSLTLLPMSDGGDGFGEAMRRLLGARIQRIWTVDAAHRRCQAKWWWAPQTHTAIIESASVIGLTMLPPRQFHPFGLDTFGLGALVQAASQKGARRCLIGIGGSATNDGGFGLARALGWQFVDREGLPIERWTDLSALARIDPPLRRSWFGELLVAVDVQNPLLGRHGATRVYGPQKGLRPEDFKTSELCLGRMARVCRSRFGHSFAAQPGAGAAGGLGFGLRVFLGGRLTPGFALFARYAGLERRLLSADLVITGEGSIDNSTLMGKGVGQLASRCRELGIPCLGLAGCLQSTPKVQQTFSAVHCLQELTTLDQANANPALWLERLAAQVARAGVPIG